jgi:UDP-N-acetylmuramoyl-L-alanyl-D-glutamate--2,6-diaminopimelate ligase
VQAGSAFIAYKGVSFDGHSQIAEAVQKKVGAVIFENPTFSEHCRAVPHFLVRDSRKAWTWLAARACGHPEQNLKLVGVTGTNGKTSTVWLYRELLRAIGQETLTVVPSARFLATNKSQPITRRRIQTFYSRCSLER